MVYIVSWVLVEIFAVTCECNKPRYDDYGRWINQNVMYDVACYDSKESSHEKRFCSLDEANEFIKNAPLKSFGMANYCKNFTVDSTDAWVD